MELQYMERLESWKDKFNDGKGLDTDKISIIESKYNITYPIAYREFLILSGDYCGAIPHGFDYDYEEENQLRAKELLDQYKLNHLIQKPFWVIATDSGAFWYFHLNEGDNPPVYRLDCEFYGDMDDIYTFGPVAESFQKWVEEAIEFYESDPENK
ncbi:SMI1/KNR4 family protein [Kordia sp.]|uniref:SMI1/KNR4 family protein n=1 Tax=Kordia sp. TaxID=1965332 RepID=UPI003B5A215A